MNELEDFINLDCFELASNDASSSSFGWNFQSNAGIFLFLKFSKKVESIKVESSKQDIELTLKGDCKKIYAQAKSSQDYTSATDSKEKMKDAIVSLSKTFSANSEGCFVYISNLPNTLNTEDGVTKNQIVNYQSFGQATRDEIDSLFDGLILSNKKKINDDKTEQKMKNKLKNINKLVASFDKSKLYISTICPYIGDDSTRYKVIREELLSFLVYELNIDYSKSSIICNRVLEHWQNRFQHNSTIKDSIKDSLIKDMKTKDLIWPILIIASDLEGSTISEDCFDIYPDENVIDEAKKKITESLMLDCNRYEFTNKLSKAYKDYRKKNPGGGAITSFVRNKWDIFKPDLRDDKLDDETNECLIKIVIYKLLRQINTIDSVSVWLEV